MEQTLHRQYRNYAAIDLAAIRHNGETARKLFPEQKILSVLNFVRLVVLFF